MAELKDNNIEFFTGSRNVTASFTNRKHINRVKKLYEQRPTEFEYFHENQDGSVCAKFPLKWVKLNPGSDVPRNLSDEQRAAIKERFAEAKAKKESEKARGES